MIIDTAIKKRNRLQFSCISDLLAAYSVSDIAVFGAGADGAVFRDTHNSITHSNVKLLPLQSLYGYLRQIRLQDNRSMLTAIHATFWYIYQNIIVVHILLMLINVNNVNVIIVN